MPRPIWNGSIAFGLVNVPVRLFSAVSHQDVRFHQLHDEDNARIKMKRTCSIDGEEVEFSHIVKGYETDDGSYVRIEPSELEGLDPKASRLIDITEFVEVSEIDPIYFENAYYLAPSENAEKTYALLCKSMQDSGKAAIGKFVMRTKEYLAAIRAEDGVLLLSTLLFADEVVEPSSLLIDSADFHELSEKELTMASQLIESLSAEFEIDKYHDEYREKVQELIDAKIAGNEVFVQPEPEPEGEVIDLMTALEQSVSAAKKNRKESA